MTIKKSLITTDWRAKGLKGNPGTRSFRACFLLLILLMMTVAVVSAAPVFISISPTACSSGGQCAATITGTGFVSTGLTTVNFSTAIDAADSKAASNVVVASSTSITMIVPAHTEGTVNVYINNGGTAGSISGFTYTGAPPTFTGFNTSANLTPGSATYYVGYNGAVKGIERQYVSTAGGALINLSGSNLKSPYYVTIGDIQNSTTDFVGLAEDNSAGFNHFNLTMKVPAHAAGDVTVTITSPNGSVSRGNLSYQSTPAITNVYPAYASTFGTDTVTITGTGGFGGASKVYFNLTDAGTVTYVNATAVTVTAPANIKGATFVNITTPGGISANAAGLFTYYDPPAIDPVSNLATQSYAISPYNSSVIGGITVNIYGKNFTAASMTGATVKFNGTAATSVTRVSDTQISAVVPAWPYITANTLWSDPTWGNMQNATVNVTTLGGTSKNNFGNFTYNIYRPNITSISPTSGSTSGGGTLTINGKNLSYARLVSFNYVTAGNPTVYNTTAGVTVVSDTQITCIIPSSTLIGARTVNVTTPAGVALTSSDVMTYTYTATEPVITTVSPNYGPDFGGQWVNITGSGFSGTAAGGVVFNGQAGNSAFVFNDSYLTVNTPAYPKGISFITVNAAGGSITKQAAYTFAGQPQITSISPIAGPTAGGNTITINGRNLTGASIVRFNVTRATGVTVVSDTQITAIAPVANGSYALPANVNVSTYITNNEVSPLYSDTTDAAGSNAYQYNSVGTWTRISPTYGPISGNTLVSFNGTGFNNATQVTFDGIPATNMLTDLNAGLWITANAPAHAAGLVNVMIVTPAGTITNTSNSYTYVGSPSNILVSPTAGPIGGGTFVTITGLSFTGATQVTFDGTPASNFTAVSDTKITANTPAHAAGPVTVTVIGTGGTGSGTYTYGSTPITATAVGVWRSGTFYRNGATSVAYGLSTDTPITGDWNADRATEVGVFRSGTFYLNGGTPVAYGLSTDTPITGDWNGDGTTEVGVFRSGMFYLNGGTSVAYGLPTDTPITGDWNGDGTTEVGVFRSGMFYLNGGTSVAYGLATDTPITGDWNADGTTEVGVFRSGTFYLNGGTPVAYGLSTDTAITGKWV